MLKSERKDVILGTFIVAEGPGSQESKLLHGAGRYVAHKVQHPLRRVI